MSQLQNSTEHTRPWCSGGAVRRGRSCSQLCSGAATRIQHSFTFDWHQLLTHGLVSVTLDTISIQYQYQYRISTVSISVLFIFGKYFNTKGRSQLENLIETLLLCCCMIFSPILLVACSQLLWVFVCLFECWGDAHYNYYETLNIINGMYGHYIYLYLQHSTMFGKYGFDIIIKTNLILECGYQKILII